MNLEGAVSLRLLALENEAGDQAISAQGSRYYFDSC
jgi:hypothetical protein